VSKVIRALCPVCSTLIRGEMRHEFVLVCRTCAEDVAELGALYTEIVTRRPWLRAKSPAEVFRALWSSWQSQQKGQ
jgi:hypothetical protein